MSDEIAELIAQIRLLAQEQRVTNDILKNSIAPQLEALRDSDKRLQRAQTSTNGEIADIKEDLAGHRGELDDLTKRTAALEAAQKPKPRGKK